MKLMLNGKEVSGMGHYVMAGDIKDATAEDSNVLSGKAYYNNNGKREGTMPNRGGMSAELAAGGSVSIPEGYHDGTGSVRAQDLASQTQGTATAGDIASGKTAWVNGSKVTGTMANPAIGFEVISKASLSSQSEYRISYPTGTTHLLFEDYIGHQYIVSKITDSYYAVMMNMYNSSNQATSIYYKRNTSQNDTITPLNTTYVKSVSFLKAV